MKGCTAALAGKQLGDGAEGVVCEREERGMVVEASTANREECLCPHCPTYEECMTMEEEVLFCGTSQTMCEAVERQGCVCGRCDVHAAFDLAGTFFCFEGPAD